MTMLELSSAFAILLITTVGLLVVMTEKENTQDLYIFVAGIYVLAQVFAETIKKTIQIYAKVSIGAGIFIVMVAKDFTIFENYISNVLKKIISCFGF
ncbi:hypothetical protein QUA71_21905 [Microcoleus sp. MON1_C5]